MRSIDLLSQKIASFEGQLATMGCLEADHPVPNLQNPIHPIFHISRWMRGHGQQTREFYNRMKIPLQLASLFITEECVSYWWTHVYHGIPTQGVNDSGETYTYLAPSPNECTASGRRKVVDALEDMSKVIVLMFTPDDYASGDNTWGCTRNRQPRTQTWPWSHHFHSPDYPSIPRRCLKDTATRHHLPEISMRHEFQRFYSGAYENMTYSQRLRVHLIFAITLVHEVAHAFWMYIGKGKDKSRVEPLWSISGGEEDGKPELGYSWETHILGRICNPLFDTLFPTHSLFSIKTHVWHPNDIAKGWQVTREMQRFYNNEGAVRAIQIPISNDEGGWLPSHHWRGIEYFEGEYLRRNGLQFMCFVHAIPMLWIAEWFREEGWEKRRKDGEGKWPLGACWSLVYERDNWGAQKMFVASRWE